MDDAQGRTPVGRQGGTHVEAAGMDVRDQPPEVGLGAAVVLWVAGVILGLVIDAVALVGAATGDRVVAIEGHVEARATEQDGPTTEVGARPAATEMGGAAVAPVIGVGPAAVAVAGASRGGAVTMPGGGRPERAAVPEQVAAADRIGVGRPAGTTRSWRRHARVGGE